MNLRQISSFSFRCKDGIHLYEYNSSAKISTFLLIIGNKVEYKHDCYCMDEYRHLSRISNDFSKNCVDVNQKSLRAKIRRLTWLAIVTMQTIKTLLNLIRLIFSK